MRIFLPIILVIAAIGLFVVWTNPTYQASKALSAQVSSYNVALDKSKELRKLRDELLSKRNTFSPDDIEKLDDILPNNVDKIRFIIDMSNIASRHSIQLRDIELGDIDNTAHSGESLALGTNSDPVGSVDISFSFTSSYDKMVSFLQDIEHSLRLIEIQKISFSADSDDRNSYSLSVRTFWLR
jgi:hypothetical protein